MAMFGPKPSLLVWAGSCKVRSNGYDAHGFLLCYASAAHMLLISVSSLCLHFGFSVAQHAVTSISQMSMRLCVTICYVNQLDSHWHVERVNTACHFDHLRRPVPTNKQRVKPLNKCHLQCGSRSGVSVVTSSLQSPATATLQLNPCNQAIEQMQTCRLWAVCAKQYKNLTC